MPALCQAVDRLLPDASVLVGDGGDFVATAAYTCRPRGPGSWIDPGAFGTLGVGGGFALGAALCCPKSEVWLLWGDGSAGYSIAELDTYVRHGLPVICLVGNDACWTQIQREQVPIFGSNVACPLEYTSYDVVAEGYGATGMEVTSADEDVGKVVKEAQRIARRTRKPVLINVHIGSTDFRDGSISV